MVRFNTSDKRCPSEGVQVFILKHFYDHNCSEKAPSKKFSLSCENKCLFDLTNFFHSFFLPHNHCISLFSSHSVHAPSPPLPNKTMAVKFSFCSEHHSSLFKNMVPSVITYTILYIQVCRQFNLFLPLVSFQLYLTLICFWCSIIILDLLVINHL